MMRRRIESQVVLLIALVCVLTAPLCSQARRPGLRPTLTSGRVIVWIVQPRAVTSIGGQTPLDPAAVRSQTAGTFGVSSTDLSSAASAANGLKPVRRNKLLPDNDPLYRRDIPYEYLDLEDVPVDDVREALDLAQKAGTMPGLIIGTLPPDSQSWLTGYQPVVPRVGTWVPLTANPLDDIDSGAPLTGWICSSCLSRPTALQYVSLFSARTHRPGAAMLNGRTEAEVIATSVFLRYLQGQPVESEFDEEMAGFERRTFGPEEPQGDHSAAADPVVQRARLVRSRLPGLDIRVEPVSVTFLGNLAFVGLRALSVVEGIGDDRYGLVVVRRNSLGRWKVAQIAPDLVPELLGPAAKIVSEAGSRQARDARNEGNRPLGIAQASPRNGEQRPPQPELWWDNLGGATLQVVEWQVGGDWRPGIASYLYFVPDSSNRLQTRVVARFASTAEPYRWRVWSVGPDGRAVVSGWRLLTILAQ